MTIVKKSLFLEITTTQYEYLMLSINPSFTLDHLNIVRYKKGRAIVIS